MKTIEYEGHDNVCLTECPYNIKHYGCQPMVGSSWCVESCKHFISTNYNTGTVTCRGDEVKSGNKNTYSI